MAILATRLSRTLQKNSWLGFILGGAAVHRCDNCPVLTVALATEGAPCVLKRLFSLPARRRDCFAIVAVLVLVSWSSAQSATEFRRTLSVSVTEPLTLEVEISSGDVQILYGRDGEVSIAGTAKASGDARLDDNFFPQVLTVRQEGNHLSLRHASIAAYPERGISVLYRIDVPYRTEIIARTIRGKQTITGILGPVTAVIENGDVKASYISRGFHGQAGSGNIDLQVIGEHAEAKTGAGNISCERIPQGVSAETGDGDITLMITGPSAAIVRKGTGRIEVGGSRGSMIASTADGDLHVKAIPHEDWKLTSSSGTIRLDLPQMAKVNLDASTGAGEFQIERDDIAKPQPGSRRVSQEVNGGGKRIEVHTESGRIVIR